MRTKLPRISRRMAEEEARGIGKARHNGVHGHQGCADVEGCGPRAVNGWCHEGDLTIATSNPKENGKKAEEAGNQCNGTALPLSCACAHEVLIDSVIRYMDNDIDVSSLSDEAVKLLKLIPEGYIPVPHQVGGHRHVDGKFGKWRRGTCPRHSPLPAHTYLGIPVRVLKLMRAHV